MKKSNESTSKNAKNKACGTKGCSDTKTASNRFYSADDPDGSYTGVPVDGGLPVQDADDL